MLTNQHILCIGADARQHSDDGRTLEIMRRLAGPNKILYVDSFSSGAPVSTALRDFRRVRDVSLGSGAERLVADVAGLHRCHPPHVRTCAAVENESPDCLWLLDIAVACEVIGLRPNLLWLADPRTASLRRWLTGITTVYQVEDILPHRPGVPEREAVARAQDELLASADAVLCGSRPLYLRLRSHARGRAHYVPPGIDCAAYGRPASLPSCLASIPRPIAGFCGFLTKYHDTDLLARCARGAPDISFVVAGSPSPRRRFAGLKRSRNLHWLDKVAPDAWPAFLQGLDVCLLPLRTASWMASACPPQLLPYLACGRPIVSTPVAQVRWLAGPYVSLAGGAAEFVEAIRWELANDTPDRAARRRAIAAQHDWSCYSRRLATALDGVASRPGVDPMACFRRYFSEEVEHARETLSPREHFSDLLGLSVTADCLQAALGFGADISEDVGQEQ
ncbi:MAG: glycosyltransferase [Phycisphaerae bacterium]|nr:glycosyltransferase [Phycisphaerae bacterium]